ncbi:hypothetical protein QN219_28610 [Sinorhizobium sp. 7-81]|uniref:hypothetical protein n=1 Tax=Sinorhizobium sp. 8-89 TaxID=3049089 RepID=UPI0024C2862D|nr:hypothetical protein [Sinorhizobium sp. 8-89]MDK1493949.1 hypothetical protein [Sinorhizobium sp. 8-89]
MQQFKVPQGSLRVSMTRCAAARDSEKLKRFSAPTSQQDLASFDVSGSRDASMTEETRQGASGRDAVCPKRDGKMKYGTYEEAQPAP